MSGLAPSDENRHEPVMILGLLFSFVVVALLVISLTKPSSPPVGSPDDSLVSTQTCAPAAQPSEEPLANASAEPTTAPLASVPTNSPTKVERTATQAPSPSATPTMTEYPSAIPTSSPIPTSVATETPRPLLQRPTRVRRTTPNP